MSSRHESVSVKLTAMDIDEELFGATGAVDGMDLVDLRGAHCH